MTHVSHAEMVRALAKPGEAILEEMSAEQAHMLHMAVGICGEAGELLDAIKKNVVYQKPIDMTHIIEEMGDIEFYLEGLRDGLQLARTSILDHNIAKLTKRYGEQYSNQAAQDRADKSTLQE